MNEIAASKTLIKHGMSSSTILPSGGVGLFMVFPAFSLECAFQSFAIDVRRNQRLHK